MRIKKLEVFGFKSFADRVVIHFDQGVTGIVGPNGCGKSNVVDALRWVMGEQNAKHLRGDSMADIIFAGAQGRNAMGLAEVVLTFENDGNLVPPEYAHFSEIEVARRIYKNGDSEYEINKRPCRLKDITELFLGTGVGTKAYSIIEQGRVANIIAAKPEEKRFIIEEAAGITKYKARRQAAERKMDATQQNLARINDVRKEVESRLGTLERQAKKAAKYRSLMEEIRDLDFHNAALQFFSHTGELGYLGVSKEALEAEVAAKQNELSSHESLLSSERNRLFEEEKKLSLSKGLLFEAESAASLSKQEIQHNEQTLILKQKQELQVHDEMRRQEEKQERLQKESEQQARELESVKNEFEAVERIGQDQGEELRALSDIRAARMRAFQDLQNRYMESAQTATKAQASLQNIETQRTMLVERASNFDKEILLNSQQLETLQQRDVALKSELEFSQNRKQDLEGDLESKSAELTVLTSEQRALESTANEMQKRQVLLTSRLTSLEEIEQSFEWSSSGIAQVMKNKKSDAILGLCADFIEVPDDLEEIVELALKDKLETVLVRSPEAALELIADLSTNKEGRLRLLALGESDYKATTPPAGKALSELIKPVGAHGRVVQQLLSRIAVVETATQAFKHTRDAWSFVTRTGDYLSADGAITGGRAAKSSGVLGRKREIRDLRVQISQIEGEQSLLQEKISVLSARRDELARELHELKQMAQNLAISLARFEENMRSRENELQRLQNREQQLLNDKAACALKEVALQTSADELQKQWAAALESHTKHEKLVQDEQENLKTVESEVSQKSEEVTILRVQIASKKERMTSLSRAIAQYAADVLECDSLKAKLIEQSKTLKEEQAELATRNLLVAKKCEDAEKEAAHLSNVLKTQSMGYERDSKLLNDRENGLSGLRTDLDECRSNLNDLSLKIERHHMALQTLSDRLHEKHRTRPEEILHEYHHLPIPDFDIDKTLADLKRQVDQLGAINPTAVEEFEELNARFLFLKMQSDDLNAALSQLESAIHKINLMTRQRFEEAFHAINERFSQVFPRLFQGGKAWLELTNPADLLSSGVEIYAQPPGKKLGSIGLMSGGEKALTAISLIFAIFLIKPSPFCLLDEVDAPLDEANVERFSQIVKEMSKVSQFIVITHNKRTMEVADQLYGVTMESAGVSKTVNVRISDQLANLPEQPDAPEREPHKLAPAQLELA
jgi:chromosome segregation protein